MASTVSISSSSTGVLFDAPVLAPRLGGFTVMKYTGFEPPKVNPTFNRYGDLDGTIFVGSIAQDQTVTLSLKANPNWSLGQTPNSLIAGMMNLMFHRDTYTITVDSRWTNTVTIDDISIDPFTNDRVVLSLSLFADGWTDMTNQNLVITIPKGTAQSGSLASYPQVLAADLGNVPAPYVLTILADSGQTVKFSLEIQNSVDSSVLFTTTDNIPGITFDTKNRNATATGNKGPTTNQNRSISGGFTTYLDNRRKANFRIRGASGGSPTQYDMTIRITPKYAGVY